MQTAGSVGTDESFAALRADTGYLNIELLDLDIQLHSAWRFLGRSTTARQPENDIA
jgi:hypothetical protein